MKNFQPAYLALLENGELEKRVKLAFEHLENCDLCARTCHVNRQESVQGAACRTGEKAVVHSFGPHHGEEDPLRGRRGSGTIFFSWCNLQCSYCQNWEISHKGIGREVEPEELAEMMLNLQERGCHNINFVSPSHVVAQILAGVLIAAGKGLRLPIIYNTGGYDSMEALALLDGVVDIYMPDMKYGDSAIARKYSRIRDYWAINQAAIHEMYRQVGDLVVDEQGLATRGLQVRHLVLPNNLANSEKVITFLAEEISKGTYLNIMAQYHPAYQAHKTPQLNRRITAKEYEEAIMLAKEYGLRRYIHRKGMQSI
ncbi:MAG: radical SAM protein [Anaerolineae bacterium]|jgi:putative pyruvate formate lyase activating enzyme|nr:radical SAM protein [Anaerolineae bacterium]